MTPMTSELQDGAFKSKNRSISTKSLQNITCPAIKFLTSSSFIELWGERTTNAIGTSPALSSGYLQVDSNVGG